MFIDKKINQQALLEFVSNFKKIGFLQQMAIVHNDELKLKFAIKPYELTDVKQVFSVSKTFTSMAIGLAIAEGKIGLHDKVIDYFKELLPKEVDPNLKKMEIYHLLTMTTGHSSCTLGQAKDNPVAAFFNLPIPYEPGTHFVYNTGASLILSVIITKVTGKSLDEYLKPMLDGLDIKEVHFEKIDNICLGGVGTHVNIDGLLNFGIMLLNNGMFNGKQLVPKAYVKMATSNLVSTKGNGTIDWVQGYGFQLWMSQVGYRCDGAYGQLVLVFPENKMVVAIQAQVESMQQEMDLVMDFIKNLYSDSKINDIEQKINDVYKIESSSIVPNMEINFDSNSLRIDKVNINGYADYVGLDFIGSNGFNLKAGNGKYIKNDFYATGIKAKLFGLMPELYEQSIVSSYYIFEDNKLEIIMKNHNTPLIQSIIFDIDNSKCELKINNKLLVGDIRILE